MQELLATILLACVAFAGFMWLYSRRRAPRFRIERQDFLDLIEDAIEGRAREDRWQLLTEIPARMDPTLMRWQQRCQQLQPGRDYHIERRDRTCYCSFGPTGRRCLQRILQEARLQMPSDRRVL